MTPQHPVAREVEGEELGSLYPRAPSDMEQIAVQSAMQSAWETAMQYPGHSGSSDTESDTDYNAQSGSSDAESVREAIPAAATTAEEYGDRHRGSTRYVIGDRKEYITGDSFMLFVIYTIIFGLLKTFHVIKTKRSRDIVISIVLLMFSGFFIYLIVEILRKNNAGSPLIYSILIMFCIQGIYFFILFLLKSNREYRSDYIPDIIGAVIFVVGQGLIMLRFL